MRVVVPDLESQENAVAQIDYLSRKPHEAIIKAEREMRLLQEFRTRLVADVVTGQVDVRTIAAALPDTPEHGTGLDSLLDDDLEDALGEREE